MAHNYSYLLLETFLPIYATLPTPLKLLYNVLESFLSQDYAWVEGLASDYGLRLHLFS